jgi:hypothetical protein
MAAIGLRRWTLNRHGQWRLLAEAAQKLRAKRAVGNDDLAERAVYDLFGVGRGFDTPENGLQLRFHTASAELRRSIADATTSE